MTNFPACWRVKLHVWLPCILHPRPSDGKEIVTAPGNATSRPKYAGEKRSFALKEPLELSDRFCSLVAYGSEPRCLGHEVERPMRLRGKTPHSVPSSLALCDTCPTRCFHHETGSAGASLAPLVHRGPRSRPDLLLGVALL